MNERKGFPKGVIKKIFQSITRGFPLLRDLKETVVPPVKIDEEGKELKPDHFLFRVFRLVLTCASVWFFCWVMAKFDMKLEDIIELFGLLN